MSLAERLLSQFRLEGETVIRASAGEPVLGTPHVSGYRVVAVAKHGAASRCTVKLHRLKFLLAHGWLPQIVDHKDQNKGNDLLSNLRAATKAQNGMNTRDRTRRNGLPRGVFPNGSGYRAEGTAEGVTHHLGTYPSAEQAASVAETFRRERHGEFFSPSPSV